MGRHWAAPRQQAAYDGWITRRDNGRRMALADKITMAVVDEIANAIIRPGPKPEERECYVMAQELREHSDHIKSLVMAILKVEEDESE